MKTSEAILLLFVGTTRLRLRLFVATLLSSLISLSTIQDSVGAQNIDTMPGDIDIADFGESQSTATYGQTITAPASSPVLTSFTFLLDDFLNTDFIDFNAYVYGWNESVGHAIGTSLFASGPLTTTNNHGLDGFESVTIATGNLSLVPSATYVLFLSTSSQFDGIPGTARSSLRTDNPYRGGHAVFANNGSDFGMLTTATWDGAFWVASYDFAFRATFIPEPCTQSLVLTGFVSWLALLRRRLAGAHLEMTL